MSLLMLVTIHSQQFLKITNLVYINADLTGDSAGCPAFRSASQVHSLYDRSLLPFAA